MQIIISIKTLAALADIADGANGNKYSNKIAFFPGTDYAIATNGHMLAFTDGACATEGGSAVITLSAKRAKVILAEVRKNKAATALGEIFLFSTQEEYDDYINEQQRAIDAGTGLYANAAFSFVPDYGYISIDNIRKIVQENRREASDVVPAFNLKYLKRAAKLWCAVSKYRNEDDPRYNRIFYGVGNTLHLCWWDDHEITDYHVVIMPYRHNC